MNNDIALLTLLERSLPWGAILKMVTHMVDYLDLFLRIGAPGHMEADQERLKILLGGGDPYKIKDFFLKKECGTSEHYGILVNAYLYIMQCIEDVVEYKFHTVENYDLPVWVGFRIGATQQFQNAVRYDIAEHVPQPD